MSSFKLNKRHFRELLIYFFKLKKSAAEAHRLLIETYGTLGVTQKAISHRLKLLGMILKGNWVPCELTPRNVERRFSTCEILLARHKRKGFLHRIVTGDGKCIHHDNPKRKKSRGPPSHASTPIEKRDVKNDVKNDIKNDVKNYVKNDVNNHVKNEVKN